MHRLRNLFVLLTVIGLAACTAAPAQPPAAQLPASAISAEQIRAALVKYIGVTAFGGRVFCAYEPLVTDADYVYVWALCQEYYQGANGLEQGTGSSLPVALAVQKTENGYRVSGFRQPDEGMSNVKSIFPPEAWPSFYWGDAEKYNARAAKLDNETLQQAKSYFGVP
jgi:hypothetical protein